MFRKSLYILFLFLLSFLLSGCWNYVSLNEITIVTGIAIDPNKDKNGYHLSFEIVDMTKSNKDEGIKTALIEAEGTTIFDAVRNAKKRSTNKLYFAHTEIILVNEEIVKKESILDLINWFLRDAEIRETISVIISREKTAKELLTLKNPTNNITSYTMKEIVKKDQMVTSSTVYTELYKIFNILQQSRQTLILPAFSYVTNNKELTVESSGIAVFKNHYLIGYIDPEQTKYILLVNDKVDGGILPVDTTGNGKDNISLEISESATKRTYKYDNNKLKVLLDIKLKVFLAEDGKQKDRYTDKELARIEKETEKKINNEVKKAIQFVQSNFDSDIFGFSNLIYQKNPNLWKSLSKDWDNIFKEIEVETKTCVEIDNTAFMK